MKKAKNNGQKARCLRGAGASKPSYVLGRPGRKKETFRFRTLDEAERTLNRVANLMVEREKGELERQLVREAYDQELENARRERQRRQLETMPPDKWSHEPMLVLPPLRGISTALGGKIVSAINAFIISRRFSDEFVAKQKVVEMEEQLHALMARLEQYRQRVAELEEARQRH